MHESQDTLWAEVAANRESILSIKFQGVAWRKGSNSFQWVPLEPPKDSTWEPGIFEVDFELCHQAPTQPLEGGNPLEPHQPCSYTN